MGRDIDKLECIIWQPADGKHDGGGDEQSGRFLVAAVSSQGRPAAPEVGDDEATVDGNAEQRGHVVNQESGNQEEEPLVAAHRPRTPHIEVYVGDFG